MYVGVFGYLFCNKVVVTWMSSRLVRQKPSWNQVAKMVGIYANLAYAIDYDIIEHACWGLCYFGALYKGIRL